MGQGRASWKNHSKAAILRIQFWSRAFESSPAGPSRSAEYVQFVTKVWDHVRFHLCDLRVTQLLLCDPNVHRIPSANDKPWFPRHPASHSSYNPASSFPTTQQSTAKGGKSPSSLKIISNPQWTWLFPFHQPTFPSSHFLSHWSQPFTHHPRLDSGFTTFLSATPATTTQHHHHSPLDQFSTKQTSDKKKVNSYFIAVVFWAGLFEVMVISHVPSIPKRQKPIFF